MAQETYTYSVFLIVLACMAHRPQLAIHIVLPHKMDCGFRMNKLGCSRVECKDDLQYLGGVHAVPLLTDLSLAGTGRN